MSRNIQFTAPYLDPPGPPVPLPEMPTELRERLKLEVQAYEAQFPFWKEKTQQAAALYVMILDFLWSDQTGRTTGQRGVLLRRFLVCGHPEA